MVLHLDEFQRPAFQGYIENVPPARRYMLSSFMPEKPTQDIDFAYNVINGAYAKAASITGWNASAPLRDKKAIEKAFGEIAKLQHGQRLDEKELLKFNRPRTDAERDEAIEYVYDTTDELSQGVDDTEEYLRAQAIYNGGMSYHDDVNDIHIDFEFDLPAGNRIDVVTAWSDPTSNPLKDIQAGVKQYQAENRRQKPAIMHINSVTEAWLLQNENIRLQVFGNQQGGQMLTTDNIQNALRALNLPAYEVNDDVIALESGEVPLLEDGKVALLGANLGMTMVGPTVENGYNTGKFVQPVIEVNPPAQTVIVGKAVFPALQRPQSIVLINVG